ncbi:hypothetical protein [Deinococcus marmoris]|uniref:hypothetical protein n=1 Tax=Deinococcus marmoris TaxID=249408 RepID=UPI000AFECD4D|nr:hypothetical protein [Deinococcus marmoris]
MKGYQRWFILAALLWALASLAGPSVLGVALACAGLPFIIRGLKAERAAGVLVRWTT